MGGKTYTIVMVILTLLLILLYILRTVLGKYYRNKLVNCVQRCDLESFERLAAEKLVRLLVPPFNIHYMRLNLYMMFQKEEEADQEFDLLLAMKTGKAMRQDVVLKAYYYYVKRTDYVRCKPLLEELKGFADEKTVHECDLLYDIYILKKSNHIDELLEGIEELPLTERAVNEYLISLQYRNRNKPDLAKEHEDLSAAYLQEALKASPQEEESGENADDDGEESV